MRIKFCGMTREQDVDEAVAHGVDAIGFVLWPESPRAVTQNDLPALARRVPLGVLPVGVFVRPKEEDVTVALVAGVRAVQLHGFDAPPAWLPASCEVWMAASLTKDGYSPDVPENCLMLLDAHDPVRHGGTGQAIDWARAAAIARQRPVMLAGGLTAASVGDAIETVQPYGVDVASGNEQRPGIKDAAAMRDFVARVRQSCP
jgi:phosphoribosylanthranilate isomerase